MYSSPGQQYQSPGQQQYESLVPGSPGQQHYRSQGQQYTSAKLVHGSPGQHYQCPAQQYGPQGQQYVSVAAGSPGQHYQSQGQQAYTSTKPVPGSPGQHYESPGQHYQSQGQQAYTSTKPVGGSVHEQDAAMKPVTAGSAQPGSTGSPRPTHRKSTRSATAAQPYGTDGRTAAVMVSPERAYHHATSRGGAVRQLTSSPPSSVLHGPAPVTTRGPSGSHGPAMATATDQAPSVHRVASPPSSVLHGPATARGAAVLASDEKYPPVPTTFHGPYTQPSSQGGSPPPRTKAGGLVRYASPTFPPPTARGDAGAGVSVPSFLPPGGGAPRDATPLSAAGMSSVPGAVRRPASFVRALEISDELGASAAGVTASSRQPSSRQPLQQPQRAPALQPTAEDDERLYAPSYEIAV